MHYWTLLGAMLAGWLVIAPVAAVPALATPTCEYALNRWPCTLPQTRFQASATGAPTSETPWLTGQSLAIGEVQPVVRGVMFWMEGCGHCEEVLTGVLPDLQEQYGGQLDIQLLEVATLDDTNRLYDTAAALGVPEEQVGVPFLILGDQTLIGSEQISQKLPALVAQHLAAGGVDYPDLAAAALSTLGGEFAGDLVATVPGRPDGFGLAIAIMVGMVAALVYSGVSLVRMEAADFVGRALARLDWLFLPLALAGLAVAVYLSYVETQMVAAVCGPVGDCNTVQSSLYSRLFGLIPIGVIGAAGYVAILTAWVVNKRSQGALATAAASAVFGFSFFGVLFSLYLTYLEPFVIRAVCIWCLTSAVIITLLMLLSLGPLQRRMAEEIDDA